MHVILMAVTLGIVSFVLALLICIYRCRKHRIRATNAPRGCQRISNTSGSQMMTHADKVALRRSFGIGNKPASLKDIEAVRSKDADMEKSMQGGALLTELYVSKEIRIPAERLLEPASPEQIFSSAALATSLTPEPAHCINRSVPVPAQNYKQKSPRERKTKPAERAITALENSIRINISDDDMDVGRCALRTQDSATRSLNDESLPSERLPAHLLPLSVGSIDSGFVYVLCFR